MFDNIDWYLGYIPFMKYKCGKYDIQKDLDIIAITCLNTSAFDEHLTNVQCSIKIEYNKEIYKASFILHYDECITCTDIIEEVNTYINNTNFIKNIYENKLKVTKYEYKNKVFKIKVIN